MEPTRLNWIIHFIWGIADDVLRDLYVRGKYRDVILPMTVLDEATGAYAAGRSPRPLFVHEKSSD
jgi:type I restriction-modification system DNA methylase subunit